MSRYICFMQKKKAWSNTYVYCTSPFYILSQILLLLQDKDPCFRYDRSGA